MFCVTWHVENTRVGSGDSADDATAHTNRVEARKVARTFT
jgi:hypothetical protein